MHRCISLGLVTEHALNVLNERIKHATDVGESCHRRHVAEASAQSGHAEIGFTALHVDLHSGVVVWITAMKTYEAKCYQVLVTSWSPYRNCWQSSGLHGCCEFSKSPFTHDYAMLMNWSSKGTRLVEHKFFAVESAIGLWVSHNNKKVIVPFCKNPNEDPTVSMSFVLEKMCGFFVSPS